MNNVAIVNVATGEMQPSIRALARKMRVKVYALYQQFHRWGYAKVNGEMWIKLTEYDKQPELWIKFDKS